MGRSLAGFTAIAGVEGIYSAQTDSLRCTAIRLASGEICLYSPVSGLGTAARDSLASLGAVIAALPKGMQVMEPEGLKTGGIRVGFKSSEINGWIVTDAFCGPKAPVGSVCDTVELLGTFPNYGVVDPPKYGAWVKDQILKDQPNMIVPCHGAFILGEKIASDVVRLIDELM